MEPSTKMALNKEMPEPLTKLEYSTWLERLLLNLLSYSLVLVPIAVIVITVKKKLIPTSIRSSVLLQWFVFGEVNIGKHSNHSNNDDSKLLLNQPNGKSHTNRATTVDKSNSTLVFLWCLFGLQASYVTWGLLQEKIMTTKYPITTPPTTKPDLSETSMHLSNKEDKFITFHDSQFLVFMNRIVAFITAILGLVYSRRRQIRIRAHRYLQSYAPQETSKAPAPFYEYIYCSFSNILSSWCQYEALKYVNFPTQCLSKSCKVIPVMLMSKILLRKRYPWIDYICAFFLAAGMFVFMLNQPIHEKSHQAHAEFKTPSRNLIVTSTLTSGLIILCLYLTFDSFTSNWQQSLYNRYGVSNWEMMAAINFYSILLTLISLYQLGNLKPAFLLLASSTLLLRDCLFMSIMSSIGQMFVYYTIKRFGSVIFAVIMTLRQFLSILLSCVIYNHHMNLGSISGLLLVFSVVGYQVWHKSRRFPSQNQTMEVKNKTPNTTFKPLIGDK